jgi:high-affinity Fe2+/Pb2+ permease
MEEQRKARNNQKGQAATKVATAFNSGFQAGLRSVSTPAFLFLR